MKVFISYHRADTLYRRDLGKILSEHGIDYYAVPEDADFNGKKNEAIRAFTCRRVQRCDVLICLVGKDTYSRPHVDREIHTALKGNVGKRLGIVAVYLPTRNDSLKHADFSTLSPKLLDNRDYVVWANWCNLGQNIESLIQEALDNANNPRIQTNHSNPCMPIKSKVYYEN